MVDMANKSLLDTYSSFRREIALLLANEIKSTGFGYKQMLIFIRLCEASATMSELSIFTQSDKGATTRAIKSMEAEGWVRKFEDPDDRRSSFVELTSSGRKKASNALKIRSQLGLYLDQTISTSDRNQLCDLLEKVIAGLREQRK